MKRLNGKTHLLLLEEVYQCEVSIEEQERIMSSSWFIDWMKEYYSKEEKLIDDNIVEDKRLTEEENEYEAFKNIGLDDYTISLFLK
jgi:hypothetical protein